MIKVLLADDHSIVRAGLRSLIEESGKMTVIAEANDGQGALNAAKENKPDVAVIDLSMPGIDGLELISLLLQQDNELPIVVLTMHEEEQYVVRSISKGAKGYLTKRSAPENLVEAIQKVHEGGRYLSEVATEALALRMARGGNAKSPVETLSNRELQVLRRLAMGHTNREIAETYNISVKTVDTYRFRLLKKLELRNNAELSRFAIKNGLVE